ALILAAVSSGQAQNIADFYKGKTVDLYIGYSVGGAYDLYARMIAKHIGRGTGFDPLLSNAKAQFEGPKFTWIGSANNEVSICVAWHTAGITKFEDLMSKELVVGGTSASADTDQFP